MNLLNYVTILVLARVLCQHITAASFEVWHSRNVGATYQHLNGVAYGNGRFVAVGVAGTVLVSSNGLDWVAASTGVTRNLNAVTFADGRFIAGGQGGTMILSSDGEVWTTSAIPTGHDVDSIGFGTTSNYPGGLFVAMVSTNEFGPAPRRRSRIITSTNAAEWELFHNDSHPLQGAFGSVANGNGRFIAAATMNGCASYSSDGRNWHQAGSCTSGTVAFGDGYFVVAVRFQFASDALTLAAVASTNGAVWHQSSGNGFNGIYSPRGICFGGSKFVAVADVGTVASSPDGTNWIVVRADTDVMLNAVTHGDGLYVAVGQGGIILTSPDAIHWTPRNLRSGRRLNDVAPDDEGFVAVGSGGKIARSTNGIVWEELQAPVTNRLAGVIKAAGQYIIAGDQGTILTGPRLTNLLPQSSGTLASLGRPAFGNGSFICVGAGGTVLSSSDGATWFPQTSGTANDLYDVIHVGSQFVAVGRSGTILTSTNGTSWQTRASPTGRDLTQIVYGRGRFVAACFAAAGTGPFALSSTDGINWEPAFIWFQSPGVVTYGNGLFLLTAGSFLGLYASIDGRNWTQHFLPTNFPFGVNRFAFNDGRFAGVGAYGLAWQSDPIISLELSKTNTARLIVHGPKNSTFRIDGMTPSTAAWQELIAISTPPHTWTDPDSENHPQRLYRAVLVP